MRGQSSYLGQRAVQVQIPGPIGGWNARDPLPEMKPNEAVILENFIPDLGGVSVRGGTAQRSSGLPSAVNSFLRYNPQTGTRKLFVASGTAFYDVSSAGTVGSAVVTGLSTDKWSTTNMGTPGGLFLVAASGSDVPRLYDGTSWSTMNINAPSDYPVTLTTSKLSQPFVFGNRLWFIEQGSARVWYLPLYSISAPGGVVTANSQAANLCALCIDFGSQLTLGGPLIAMANWTSDGSTSATNDYAVLISAAGQILIYTGQDPNQTSFVKVGLYRIPPPVGTRCYIQQGADLNILTQSGVIPLSKVMSTSDNALDIIAVTDRIRKAFRSAYGSAPGAFGWEVNEYPKGSLFFVNVPQTTGAAQQYVMNSLTGSWCNWTGLNAVSFCLFGDLLLFGTPDGKVMQYDTGSQDSGSPISAIVLPAYSDFKNAGKKRFVLAKPLYTGAVGYRPAIKLAVNYDATRATLPQGTIPAGGTPWRSPWGSPWGPPQGSSDQWQGISGVAQNASVLMSVVTNNPFRLDHIDLQFEPGNAF